MPHCFLMRNIKAVDSGSRGGVDDVGEVGRWLVTIRIYFMKNIFQ